MWKEMSLHSSSCSPGICLEGLSNTTNNRRVYVRRPKLEPGMYWIRDTCAIHSTATFVMPALPVVLYGRDNWPLTLRENTDWGCMTKGFEEETLCN